MEGKTNGYTRAQLDALLGEIDRADDELATLNAEYMQSCKGPHADINAVYERAKNAGLGVRSFRTLVKNRRLERAKQRNIDRLDLDQRADYAQMTEALGVLADTPLGQAALRESEQVLDTLA